MALPEEFRELARAVNNWGRWGDADERGTVNLVDPEAVRRGAAAARTGRAFALAIPLSGDGPQIGAIAGRINPLRTMVMLDSAITGDPEQCTFNDDVVVMGLQAATHWDSLAHVTYDGRMYNGFPTSSTTVAGAARCGIDKIGVIVSRGILLDVARARGVERLEPGHAITGDDLDAAVELARVVVQPGDVVLVRTGHMELFRQRQRKAYVMTAPGLSMRSARWFRDHDVAAVGIDTFALEVLPGEREDVLLPVHLLHVVEMGLTQGQNFDLEGLAADCADDGVYEFLLSATPEPFVAGLGGPVAPVAVK